MFASPISGTHADVEPRSHPLGSGRRDGLTSAGHGRASSRFTDARATMVNTHIGLARSLARRFANRGESLDDLNQVALLGLLKAVDRFDPDRGVQFSTFATATISGELKRHFRDKRWGVHVSRMGQERYLAVRDTADDLITFLGRAPSVQEIAERVGLTPEEVIEAQEAATAFHLASLDTPGGPAGEQAVQIGTVDKDVQAIEARLVIEPMVRRLSPREQAILRLRFVDRMSQSQIARELHISQMHVSRLLNRSLALMRSWLDEA